RVAGRCESAPPIEGRCEEGEGMRRYVSRASLLGATLVCLLALTPAVAAAGSASGHSRAAARAPAPLTPPGDGPTVKPLSSVAEGQRGIGWTVQHGTTREP